MLVELFTEQTEMKAFELLAICPGRLLSSFQNNLDEITIIATPDDEDVEGQMNLPKNVQLHSFLDPAKGDRVTTHSACACTPIQCLMWCATVALIGLRVCVLR